MKTFVLALAAAAVLTGSAFSADKQKVVDRVYTEKVTVFDANGMPTGKIQSKNLLGKSVTGEVGGFLRIATDHGDVLVNPSAVHIDIELSTPDCHPILTHDNNDNTNGTNAISGTCKHASPEN
jgi:hypothetical protein